VWGHYYLANIIFMERLSLVKYGWRCVLGMGVFYISCLSYGTFFLSGQSQALHHALFELIPGFVWGNPLSLIWGAVYLFGMSWVVALYMVWMHNSSLVAK